MICCICSNVPWEEVKKLQSEGLSLEEIKEKLNLGKECGLCLLDLKPNNS